VPDIDAVEPTRCEPPIALFIQVSIALIFPLRPA
jgi:hypothetical protein